MSVHHEVTMLLPWYVNGTLNEQEMAMVEAHLEHCTGCRETVPVEVQRARRLHADGEDARVAALVSRRGREFQALRNRLRLTPVNALQVDLRWVPALATLLLIALAIPVVWVARQTDQTLYELRTNPVAIEAPVLQLVFKDGTSADDIDLLIGASGTLLGPPSAQGIYRIALATDDPQAMLTRIRTHPAVRWAEIEL